QVHQAYREDLQGRGHPKRGRRRLHGGFRETAPQIRRSGVHLRYLPPFRVSVPDDGFHPRSPTAWRSGPRDRLSPHRGEEPRVGAESRSGWARSGRQGDRIVGLQESGREKAPQGELLPGVREGRSEKGTTNYADPAGTTPERPETAQSAPSRYSTAGRLCQGAHSRGRSSGGEELARPGEKGRRLPRRRSLEPESRPGGVEPQFACDRLR